jgi:hypothetical protein
MNLIHVTGDISVSGFHKEAGWSEMSVCGASGYGPFSAHPSSLLKIFARDEIALLRSQ